MMQAANIQNLTPRQSEIIGLIAQGKSNKQAATLLSISTETVRAHIVHACKKINVENRIQLIVAWVRWQTIQEINNHLLDLSR